MICEFFVACLPSSLWLYIDNFLKCWLISGHLGTAVSAVVYRKSMKCRFNETLLWKKTLFFVYEDKLLLTLKICVKF